MMHAAGRSRRVARRVAVRRRHRALLRQPLRARAVGRARPRGGHAVRWRRLPRPAGSRSRGRRGARHSPDRLDLAPLTPPPRRRGAFNGGNMKRLVLGAAVARARRRVLDARAQYPRPAGDDDRAVPAGRRRRHRRPADRRGDGRGVEAAGGDREQGRRGRRHRHGARREGQARRLHDPDGALVAGRAARGRQDPGPRAGVPGEGPGADRAHHRRPHGARRARGLAVEDLRRVHGLCEGQSRQAQLRLLGKLRHDAHPDGDADERDGDADDARALHGRRSGDRRIARRPGGRDLHRSRPRSCSTCRPARSACLRTGARHGSRCCPTCRR